MELVERKYRIALVAMPDYGKAPVRALQLKAWLERKQSPLHGKIIVDLLQPKILGKVDDVLPKLEADKPNFVLLYNQLEWDNTTIYENFLHLKQKIPNIIFAITNDGVDRISIAEAEKYGISFIFEGDIEPSFEKLILDFLQRKRGADNCIKTEKLYDGGSIENLDIIPAPYTSCQPDLSNTYITQVLISSGCYNRCAYCPIHDNMKSRYHSPEYVLKEILYIVHHARKLKRILLITTDFFDSPTVPLFGPLVKIGEETKIKFDFYTHAGVFRSEEVLKLANSNTFNIRIGVQSFNDKALKAVNRNYSAEQAKNNILRMRKYAPNANISLELIRGLPYDDANTYFSTLEWCMAANFNMYVNQLLFLPDTPLSYSQFAKSYKISKNLPFYALSSNVLSEEQMKHLIERTKDIFFIISLVKSEHKLFKLFFEQAHEVKNIYPHITLARGWCKILDNSKELSNLRLQFISQMHKFNQNTYSQDFFSEENKKLAYDTISQYKL